MHSRDNGSALWAKYIIERMQDWKRETDGRTDLGTDATSSLKSKGVAGELLGFEINLNFDLVLREILER